MKTSKKLLATAIATLAVGGIAPVANAELSASATVASSYLWRGIDLGSGTPAVSGDLVYSTSGFYGGVWTSSGDTGAGSEFDLFVGYGGESGDFSYDISIWNYIYPGGGVTDAGGPVQEDSFGDLSEIILTLGFGPVSFSWYENIATGEGGDEEYRYFTLGAGTGPYSATLGAATGDTSAEYLHLDIGYAFNDSLSFTFSQVIDDDDDAVDDDLKVVVSYSLPIE